MVSSWPGDDDRLLADLAEATRATSEVPPEFVTAAKTAFMWRDADTDLALLTYDSALDRELAAATRGVQRILIFSTGEVTIEAELGGETLLGQVIPVRPGTVERQLTTGEIVSASIDANGCFVIRPAPSATFRLRCRWAGSATRTDWVSPPPR